MLAKQAIRAHFNRAAQRYDEHADLQRCAANDLLQTLTHDMQHNNDAKILELGAGSGIFTKMLLNNVQTQAIISLDCALQMLMQLKKQNLAKSPICITADFDALPFHDEYFTLVTANLSLQWSLALSQTYNEIQRVLQPGAKFCFTTLGPHTLHELNTSWQQTYAKSPVNQQHSVRQIQQYLHNAGFHNVQLTRHLVTQQVQRLSNLLNTLKKIGASYVIKQTTSGLITRGHWQTVENYYQQHFATQGKLNVSYEIFIITCQKVIT